MIPLHRLTHPESVFFLNPDLILTLESTPDTVVTLTNATKVIVIESPREVAALIRDWRAGILGAALGDGAHGRSATLAEVLPLAASVAPTDRSA